MARQPTADSGKRNRLGFVWVSRLNRNSCRSTLAASGSESQNRTRQARDKFNPIPLIMTFTVRLKIPKNAPNNMHPAIHATCRPESHAPV